MVKTSKTETVVAESTVSTHTRNSSYPEPGVEVSTSTKSLQVQ